MVTLSAAATDDANERRVCLADARVREQLPASLFDAHVWTPASLMHPVRGEISDKFQSLRAEAWSFAGMDLSGLDFRKALLNVLSAPGSHKDPVDLTGALCDDATTFDDSLTRRRGGVRATRGDQLVADLDRQQVKVRRSTTHPRGVICGYEKDVVRVVRYGDNGVSLRVRGAATTVTADAPRTWSYERLGLGGTNALLLLPSDQLVGTQIGDVLTIAQNSFDVEAVHMRTDRLENIALAPRDDAITFVDENVSILGVVAPRRLHLCSTFTVTNTIAAELRVGDRLTVATPNLVVGRTYNDAEVTVPVLHGGSSDVVVIRVDTVANVVQLAAPLVVEVSTVQEEMVGVPTFVSDRLLDVARVTSVAVVAESAHAITVAGAQETTALQLDVVVADGNELVHVRRPTTTTAALSTAVVRTASIGGGWYVDTLRLLETDAQMLTTEQTPAQGITTYTCDTVDTTTFDDVLTLRLGLDPSSSFATHAVPFTVDRTAPPGAAAAVPARLAHDFIVVASADAEACPLRSVTLTTRRADGSATYVQVYRRSDDGASFPTSASPSPRARCAALATRTGRRRSPSPLRTRTSSSSGCPGPRPTSWSRP